MLNLPENHPGSRDSLVFLMIARNSSSQAALRVLGVSELVGWKICVSCFCVSFLNEFTASPKTDGTPQKITR